MVKLSLIVLLSCLAIGSCIPMTMKVSSMNKTQEYLPNSTSSLICNLDQENVDEIRSYQATVNQIIDLFTEGKLQGTTFDLLAELTDTFGSRMTGTQALEDAIDWVVKKSKTENFDVHTESFKAPHWVRNEESLFLISPRIVSMSLLGLGSSVGTGKEGIKAEALVVSSFEELAASAEKASGKIIVFDAPFVTYGETVKYRTRGASEVARVGGLASIIRSVADFSIVNPHTGQQFYEGDVEKIPAAAITIEDAAMLHRMQDRGEKIVLHLTMGAENLADVTTRNTIIDVVGSESPQEVVVVSGHLDSWDVGTGAMDDAGGCVISWMVGKAVNKLSLTPRRTLRTIMFAAEEQGVYGGNDYFKMHGTEKENFQLMMESDMGTFNPRGIGFTGTEEGACMMKEILKLTERLGTTELFTTSDTPDLGGFRSMGVPIGSLYTENDRYFWYHHSPGDRMEVEDPETLDKISALWASVAYVTSDISFRIPQKNNSLIT